MKRSITCIAGVLLAVSAVQAELSTGPIEDYMPTITVNAAGMGEGNQYQHQYQLGEFDLVEGELSRYRLKEDCQGLSKTNGCGIITLQDLEFDPDPTVFANQLIYNNTGSTQTYNINISQPAYLATSTSQVYGSIEVTLLDQAGDGATLTDNNTPVYQSYIDGNLVDTLMDNPYSVSTTPPSTTVGSGLQEFGWDNWGTGVASNISIAVQFTLTSGDSASVQSRFDVVPEPASMLLIGISVSAFTFIRRRFVG